MKNSKIVTINTDLKKLMKYWLKFTEPFHGLTQQQQKLIALLLYYYFDYKQVIKSEKVVWKMVFDYDTKMKIKEELDNLPDYTLQNLLSILRKKEVIKNNKINHIYIPNLELNAKDFTIVYKFNIMNNDG